jgi:hypothetical protein
VQIHELAVGAAVAVHPHRLFELGAADAVPSQAVDVVRSAGRATHVGVPPRARCTRADRASARALLG